MCEKPEDGERLSVHHLIPDSKIPEELDAHLSVNLVALCRPCHSELETKPLRHQLLKLGIEDREELILSDTQREKLNNRLENIGPNILKVKKISKSESEEFLKQDFDTGDDQTSLFDF